MKIAILGYGVVGSGVDLILRERNIGITCEKILVKSYRLKEDIRNTDNFDDIINDSSIDLIVETLNGINPAYEYIKKALESHKHVVSANKAVIAKYFDEFKAIAASNNVSFFYEASVCGVLPIIRLLHNVSRIDDISRIEGIMNGTSNYILDVMTKSKKDFAEVLKQAQALGYAEKDPTSDIEGYDIKNKIIIAASIAFRININECPIYTCGISNITLNDIYFFEKHNSVVKLMANACNYDDHFSIDIMPTLFSRNAIEANIELNNNLVSIYSKQTGKLTLMGQGAGKLPTAHSIVEDLVDIKEHNQIMKNECFGHKNYRLSSELHNYIIRSDIKLTGKLINGNYYLFEDISLKDILNIYENLKLKDAKALIFRVEKGVKLYD